MSSEKKSPDPNMEKMRTKLPKSKENIFSLAVCLICKKSNSMSIHSEFRRSFSELTEQYEICVVLGKDIFCSISLSLTVSRNVIPS